MQPHWQQAHEYIEAQPAVSLVQDTTYVDHSHHPKTNGVGQIGNGRGQYLQTVLALTPEIGDVLNCAIPDPFVCIPALGGEMYSKRRQREAREAAIWIKLVHRLGSFPEETLAVHVGDREMDRFPVLSGLPNHPYPCSGARLRESTSLARSGWAGPCAR